jgi:hypothetical protein
MLVIGSGNVQTTTTDVVDSLVVDKKRAIGMLDGAVGGKNGVVRFDDRG